MHLEYTTYSGRTLHVSVIAPNMDTDDLAEGLAAASQKPSPKEPRPNTQPPRDDAAKREQRVAR